MHTPVRIALHLKSAELELDFGNDNCRRLSAEYLRVHSPSAEVRGHGGSGAILQTGKRGIAITNIEPTGNYALKISFSDGHDTGLYNWNYLHDLSVNRDIYWERYMKNLKNDRSF